MSGNLTDNALEHLKDMPLSKADFTQCSKITDKALSELKARLIV